jgi:hypothetical protein
MPVGLTPSPFQDRLGGAAAILLFRSVGLVIAAAIIVTVTGTICGLLGGGLARLLARQRAA